jgi:hypothetical protein
MTRYSSKSGSWRVRTALVIIALLHLSCQLPVQPTTVTVNAPTAVVVEDQGNNPVKDRDVLVQWKILRATDSSWHIMPPKNAPLYDGSFQDVIPIPVGDDTSHIVFQVSAPIGYVPAVQLDTEIGYCGSKVFTFQITQTPITITTCDPAAKMLSVTLSANEPSHPRDTARTPVFINSLANLNFSYSAVPPIPGPPTLPNIVVEYSTSMGVGATWSALPATINSGATYLFRFRFTTDSLGTQNSSNQYVVTINGLDAAGDTCVKLVSTVNMQIKVQTPCDCPAGTFTYFDTASTCISQGVSDTISLNIPNSNTQCQLVLSRAASSVLDNDITISPDLSGTVIQPNQQVPNKLILTFTPRSAKTYDVHYDYMIDRRAPDGTLTRCDSVLRIYFHGTVGTPSCQVDPNSGLLHDTLFQVINSDSSSGVRSLCIKNTGLCLVSITSAVIAGASPHPFHITTGLPIVASAGQDGCVPVSFNPTEADVWPAGRSAGINPIDTFRAILHITTSAGCDTTIPIIGVIIPTTDNPNCFLPWGSDDTYTGIVLGDSGTVSISPNRGTPNGFSIYVTAVNATNATLFSGTSSGGSNYVKFTTIASNVTIISPQTICDKSGQYAGQCGTTNATTSSGPFPVSLGDVVLFEYMNPVTGVHECGLMFIEGFVKTNQTDPNAPYKACFQLCFPI